jgi:hypothetical protein
MERIHINKTKVSPEVILDPNTGYVEICGESYPENSLNFYRPVVDWLKKTVEDKREIEFNFKLDYFNTSSSKCILDILGILEKYNQEGGKVIVNWYYNDDDMLEAGEDFLSDLNLPYKLISSQ